MDTAFTPPIAMMATPERAHAPAIGPPRWRRALTRGKTAHGARRPGRTAAEVEPTTMVNVGHRAKAMPASSRELSEPIRSAVASLVKPQKPTATRSESHSRSISQTGIRSSWPARKNGPIGIA